MALAIWNQYNPNQDRSPIGSQDHLRIINSRQNHYKDLAERHNAANYDDPEFDEPDVELSIINSPTESLENIIEEAPSYIENDYQAKHQRLYKYRKKRETPDAQLIFNPGREIERIDQRGVLKNSHKGDNRFVRGKSLRRALKSMDYDMFDYGLLEEVIDDEEQGEWEM